MRLSQTKIESLPDAGRTSLANRKSRWCFQLSHVRRQLLDDAAGARSPRGQCQPVCTSTNLSKSALINTMLYRQVLPVGAVPVTAVTTVTFGTPERVLVVDYLGGASRDEPLAGLARVPRPAAGRLSSWRQRRID
jgi:hypothetical protein